MDRLDQSLDTLVKDSRKERAPIKTSMKDKKKATAGGKKMVVKTSSSQKSVKSKPERELRQPTPSQVVNSLARAAPDSVLSRLGPKQEGKQIDLLDCVEGSLLRCILTTHTQYNTTNRSPLCY